MRLGLPDLRGDWDAQIVVHLRGLEFKAHRLACTGVPHEQFKNNYFAEMWIGSEAGSYLRRIDLCIIQL